MNYTHSFPNTTGLFDEAQNYENGVVINTPMEPHSARDDLVTDQVSMRDSTADAVNNDALSCRIPMRVFQRSKNQKVKKIRSSHF